MNTATAGILADTLPGYKRCTGSIPNEPDKNQNRRNFPIASDEILCNFRARQRHREGANIPSSKAVFQSVDSGRGRDGDALSSALLIHGIVNYRVAGSAYRIGTVELWT